LWLLGHAVGLFARDPEPEASQIQQAKANGIQQDYTAVEEASFFNLLRRVDKLNLPTVMARRLLNPR
jgi:hypothetical protein